MKKYLVFISHEKGWSFVSEDQAEKDSKNGYAVTRVDSDQGRAIIASGKIHRGK